MPTLLSSARLRFISRRVLHRFSEKHWETVSPNVAQAALKLGVLLPYPPRYGNTVVKYYVVHNIHSFHPSTIKLIALVQIRDKIAIGSAQMTTKEKASPVLGPLCRLLFQYQ
ncbi:hypothetical protein STEG23_032344, partial [Scotinomys teguina]